MQKLDKIEILQVNSDSEASENEKLDRELELENRIINRVNKEIPDYVEVNLMKEHNRLEQIEVDPKTRQFAMAEDLIEIIKKTDRTLREQRQATEHLKLMNEELQQEDESLMQNLVETVSKGGNLVKSSRKMMKKATDAAI